MWDCLGGGFPEVSAHELEKNKSIDESFFKDSRRWDANLWGMWGSDALVDQLEVTKSIIERRQEMVGLIDADKLSCKMIG